MWVSLSLVSILTSFIFNIFVSFCFLVEVYLNLTRPRSLYFSVTKEFQCSPSRIILLPSYAEVETQVMTFMFSLFNIRTRVKYHPRIRALFNNDTLKWDILCLSSLRVGSWTFYVVMWLGGKIKYNFYFSCYILVYPIFPFFMLYVFIRLHHSNTKNSY